MCWLRRPSTEHALTGETRRNGFGAGPRFRSVHQESKRAVSLLDMRCGRPISWILERREQPLRVDLINQALYLLAQAQLLDRANAFADKHRPTLGIERAITREHDAIRAEEFESAAQRRSGTTQDRVAIEHL